MIYKVNMPITDKSEASSRIETQVADVFSRAHSGEPFGTKEDVNILIEKICDHIYRKLLEENWCPCKKHMDASCNNSDQQSTEGTRNVKQHLSVAGSGFQHDGDAEGGVDATPLHNVAASNDALEYMQRMRTKVLQILSGYLATFKEQLLTKYNMGEGTETDERPNALVDDIPREDGAGGAFDQALQDVVVERVNETLAMGATEGVDSRESRSSSSSLSDVSMDDWVIVGRCLSQDESLRFERSPGLPTRASSTSAWSSPDPDSRDNSHSNTARRTPYFPTTTSTTTSNDNEDDNKEKDGGRIPIHEGRARSTGDKAMERDDDIVPKWDLVEKTFKKTRNPKLIKKSNSHTSGPDRTPLETPSKSQQLLTASEDYRGDHFYDSSARKKISVIHAFASAGKKRSPLPPVRELRHYSVDIQPSSPPSDVSDSTHIGGVPAHLFGKPPGPNEPNANPSTSFARALPRRPRRRSSIQNIKKGGNKFWAILKMLRRPIN